MSARVFLGIDLGAESTRVGASRGGAVRWALRAVRRIAPIFQRSGQTGWFVALGHPAPVGGNPERIISRGQVWLGHEFGWSRCLGSRLCPPVEIGRTHWPAVPLPRSTHQERDGPGRSNGLACGYLRRNGSSVSSV